MAFGDYEDSRIMTRDIAGGFCVRSITAVII